MFGGESEHGRLVEAEHLPRITVSIIRVQIPSAWAGEPEVMGRHVAVSPLLSLSIRKGSM